MADRNLIVRIIGDDRAYQQALTRSTAATARFERDVNLKTARVGQGLRGALSNTGGAGGFLFGSGAFIASAAITASITKSVSAASDLNETISKSRQVFGDASAEVEKFGDTAAGAIGVSKQQAIEAAATFGNLFRTVGLAGTENAQFSSSLVKLAADLASFNNVNPADALLALRSGLIGEAEPLRRFGVLLSEARVQQVALANTGKTSTKALTDQEKVLARYQIILKDTVSAQGDFARTSDGLANQTRTLKANLSDLAANMGSAFLPAVNASVGALNDLFETGTLQAEVLDQIRAKIQESGVSMKQALPALQAYRDGLAQIKGEGDAVVQALDQIIQRQSALATGRNATGPENLGGARGPGAITQSNAEVETAKQNAKDQLALAQATITAITRQVAAQGNLNRQFADSEKRAAHLRDLIREDPDNAKLQGRLREELERQATLRKQIADASATAAADAARSAASARAEAAAAAATRKEREREAAIRRRAARQADQFAALGLTAEGDRPTPGSGALLRRAQSLQDQVRGTPLDTAKTNAQLKRIVSVLKTNFKTAGRDVRQAILQMLNEISEALEGGNDAKKGPLTRTSGLNTLKITAGLGLTPEQERLLRSRLSGFNSAGTAFANRSTSARPGGFSTSQTVEVTVNTETTLDGEKIGKSTTKVQQKTKRRNPQQKRGPNRRK